MGSFGVMSSRNGVYGTVAEPCVMAWCAGIPVPKAPNVVGCIAAGCCPKNDVVVLFCPNAEPGWTDPNALVPGCCGCCTGVDAAPNPNVVPGCADAPKEPNPVVAGFGAPKVFVDD